MDWGIGKELENIAHKTLVVASDLDYTPISFKEEFVSRMQNARLAVITNSRHGVLMDQYEKFNNLIINFLENE
jgi:pimeloyl-ACP methyl ester carboxylesterase